MAQGLTVTADHLKVNDYIIVNRTIVKVLDIKTMGPWLRIVFEAAPNRKGVLNTQTAARFELV